MFFRFLYQAKGQPPPSLLFAKKEVQGAVLLQVKKKAVSFFTVSFGFL